MQAYTISIDSTQATQNTIFTVDLSGTFSLVNISKVEVLKASVSVSSNVSAVYVYIDELSDNRFNKRVAKLKDKFDSYIQTTASNPIMNQTNNNLVTGSTSLKIHTSKVQLFLGTLRAIQEPHLHLEHTGMPT